MYVCSHQSSESRVMGEARWVSCVCPNLHRWSNEAAPAAVASQATAGADASSSDKSDDDEVDRSCIECMNDVADGLRCTVEKFLCVFFLFFLFGN